MAMNDTKSIYLVTVFEKLEECGDLLGTFGDTRSVGWFPSFTLAHSIVVNNTCDLWESSYDYACIEKLSCGLYPSPRERWLYKYSQDTGTYETINAPVFLKHYVSIGGIG
jgi:hypothetical protein